MGPSCSMKDPAWSSMKPLRSGKVLLRSVKEASCEGVRVWEMVEEVAGMTDEERVGITDLYDVTFRQGDGLFSAFILSLALRNSN